MSSRQVSAAGITASGLYLGSWGGTKALTWHPQAIGSPASRMLQALRIRFEAAICKQDILCRTFGLAIGTALTTGCFHTIKDPSDEVQSSVLNAEVRQKAVLMSY